MPTTMILGGIPTDHNASSITAMAIRVKADHDYLPDRRLVDQISARSDPVCASLAFNNRRLLKVCAPMGDIEVGAMQRHNKGADTRDLADSHKSAKIYA
jgi:hypothetical protein